MASLVQTAFSRGEISPSLYGRVDTAIYQVALKTARNMYIHTAGGASNRPGTKFIGWAKEHDTFVRAIPFKFKTTDTYMLEFGNLYMRVVRNDAHVLEDAKTITGATAANPVVVTAAAHGFANGDDVEISGVVGMTELNGRRFQVASATTNTFTLTHPVTGDNIDGTTFTAYSSGGTVARVYTLATPYAAADLANLKFVQSADVMTLTHPDYDVRELARTDHDAWTLTEITFAPSQDHPTGQTVTQNGTPGSKTRGYKVTAIADETLEESISALNNTTVSVASATAANPVVVTATSHGFADGDEVELNDFSEMTEVNGRRFTVANKTANTFELEGEDGSGYAAEVTGGSANQTFVTITNGAATLSATDNVSIAWTAVSGAQRYAVYRLDNGLYGLIGETEDTSYTDDGSKNADLDSSPPRPRLPFLGAGNAPSAVSYYEQRQVFANTNNKPDTTFYSQVGSFQNLSVSTPGQADDAITATLNSREVNEIRHLVPLSDLVILTSGGEWRVNSSDESGGFSADTLRQKPQSEWGAGHQRPAVIGSTIVFVGENNRTVRSLGFSLELDGYASSDLTILSDHLFRYSGITDFAFAKADEPMIAAVRADGKVGVLTLNQEQEVVAWALWDMSNLRRVQSVAAVRPSSAEPDEAFYFVVRRPRFTSSGLFIDGYVQTIERVHSRRFSDVRDAFFVDAGVTYDGDTGSAVQYASNSSITHDGAVVYSIGDTLDISGIEWLPEVDEFQGESQPQQLNGYRVLVSNTTLGIPEHPAYDSFQFTDEDGDAIDGTDWMAYAGGGTIRVPTTTISGLDHLEGDTVVALADGNVVEDLVVTNGSVTLPRAASRVYVGLRYVSDLETLDIETRNRSAGTLQDKPVNVPSVTVKFERSRGLFIGPDAAHLDEMKQREDERMGDPTALLTGTREVQVQPNWKSKGRIFLRQLYPLPMTILAVIPKLDVGDD